MYNFININKKTHIQITNNLNILTQLHTHTHVILIDKTVNKNFKISNLINTKNTIEIHSNEHKKSVTTFAKIIDNMNQLKLYKSTTLVVIGGGVLGDIGGLIAKCYYRGIKLINIPTTLLAQVDSAIGSKNAINTYTAKNIIGSFKHAKTIILYTNFITTLSNYTLTCGLAEVIKIAIINTKSLFKFIINNTARIINKQINTLKTLVKIAIMGKFKILKQDPKETKNIRTKLNLGHTFAHAIEKYLNYSINHGEAVMMGLILATKISNIKPNTSKKIIKLINTIKPYTHLNLLRINIKSLINNIEYDKKKIDTHQINFILIKTIGKVITKPISIQTILKQIS